jgi:hypothetical protein
LKYCRFFLELVFILPQHKRKEKDQGNITNDGFEHKMPMIDKKKHFAMYLLTWKQWWKRWQVKLCSCWKLWVFSFERMTLLSSLHFETCNKQWLWWTSHNTQHTFMKTCKELRYCRVIPFTLTWLNF